MSNNSRLARNGSNASLPARSAVRPLAEPPVPPFLGPRRLEGITLGDAWPHLDRNTLFRHHWGGWKAKKDFRQIVEREFEPTLAALQQEVISEAWMEPLIAYGYFPIKAMDTELVTKLIHSANERAAVDDLELGVEMLRSTARALLGPA